MQRPAWITIDLASLSLEMEIKISGLEFEACFQNWICSNALAFAALHPFGSPASPFYIRCRPCVRHLLQESESCSALKLKANSVIAMA